MPNALKDHGLLIEAVTRARKTVICVTRPGSSFCELFQNAINHKDTQTCSNYEGEESCPFISTQMITLQKDEVC